MLSVFSILGSILLMFSILGVYVAPVLCITGPCCLCLHIGSPVTHVLLLGSLLLVFFFLGVYVVHVLHVGRAMLPVLSILVGPWCLYSLYLGHPCCPYSLYLGMLLPFFQTGGFMLPVFFILEMHVACVLRMESPCFPCPPYWSQCCPCSCTRGPCCCSCQW